MYWFTCAKRGITYPYEAVMKEHPKEMSWDFRIMHGSIN